MTGRANAQMTELAVTFDDDDFARTFRRRQRRRHPALTGSVLVPHRLTLGSRLPP